MLKCFLATILLTFVAIASLAQPATRPERSSTENFRDWIMGGVYEIGSNGGAAAVEDSLSGDPNNLKARAQLISYYGSRIAGKGNPDQTSVRRHAQHVLWLVEQHPELLQAGVPFTYLSPELQPGELSIARKSLLERAEKDSADAVRIEQAALFLLHSDNGVPDLLTSALKTVPDRARTWYFLRYRFYYSRALRGKGTPTDPENALADLESCLKLSNSNRERAEVLVRLPECALVAGNLDKAASYAEQLLKDARKLFDNDEFGDVVQDANVVLGQVALRRNHIEDAKIYLQKAADAPPTPDLSSWGPNMKLAKELLARGEKEAVLTYIDKVGSVWKSDMGTVASWKEAINHGQMPDFGGHD